MGDLHSYISADNSVLYNHHITGCGNKEKYENKDELEWYFNLLLFLLDVYLFLGTPLHALFELLPLGRELLVHPLHLHLLLEQQRPLQSVDATLQQLAGRVVDHGVGGHLIVLVLPARVGEVCGQFCRQ